MGGITLPSFTLHHWCEYKSYVVYTVPDPVPGMRIPCQRGKV